MRLTQYLDGINGPIDWGILRVLVGARDAITGRQMSYLLGVNHGTCTRHLEQLVKHGFLSRQIVGRAYLYRLSDLEIVQQSLVPFINAEIGLKDHLFNEIAQQLGCFCHGIVVFGDYALDMVDSSSVLELLFIAKANAHFARSLSELEQMIAKRYDIPLKTAVFTLSELTFGKKRFIWDEISQKGLCLMGDLFQINQKLNRIASHMGHFSKEMQKGYLNKLIEMV